ncbi:MAG: carbon starvation protein A [Deltaproteobacteria bacterium]|nr:carbon starvation protein A [Deltaproteobacteria bacterium]
MNVLVPLLIGGVLLAVASRFYGGFLARWLGLDDKRKTPAVVQEDGRDFVPTRPHVLFAHHFSAIAGAGPILGPTMALLYGYAPGWFWIILGGIFFGAAHDLSALFVSVRSGGRSMAEIARSTLGNAGFTLFILFSLVLIVLVTSAFLAATSISLTSMWPLEKLGLGADQTLLGTATNAKGQTVGVIGGIASTSVVIITMFSPLLGYLMYKRRMGTVPSYLLAAAICAGSVVAGFFLPIRLDPQVWMIVLAVYVLFAAGVPVWVILQPRDFINVQILYVGIALLVGGLISVGIQGAEIGAPAANVAEGTAKLGLMWPMLFITIACGAISGFHCMVASGTSAKQVSSERYVKRIGYDAMLLESLLALCVLVAVGSMLGFGDYKSIVFPADPAVKSNPILAFSLAVGHLLQTGLGIPTAYGTVAGILLVEGFVITTLDAAVRLNRYLFEELWEIILGKDRVPALMRHPWFNSGLSVVFMLFLAWTNAFNAIWPIFGSANQLLAALSLIAASAWLVAKGGKRFPVYTLVPAVVMLITTVVSLLLLLPRYVEKSQWSLVAANVTLLALSLGVAILAVVLRRKPAPAAAAAAPSRGGDA